MPHILAIILGSLGPLVVFTLSPRLKPLPRALLWLLGVPCYCMGVVTLLLRLPGGGGSFPALAWGIGTGIFFVAFAWPRP